MSQTVVKHFIEPLQALFGSPNSDDPEKFLSLVIKSLSSFPADILDAAVTQIASTATKRYWPMPGVCAETCRQIQSDRWKAERQEGEPYAKSETAERKVREQRASDMLRRWHGARQAVEEGWIAVLFDFVTEQGRLPDLRETRAMQARAAENERTIAELDKMGSLGLSLLNAGEAIMKRRGIIADRIFGEAA
jgi:hypothetical protein